MEDYRPNSHKSKAEAAQQLAEKKVEKVISGAVKTRKKSGVTKIANELISEDASRVKSHLLLEVLVPAVKKLIKDIVVDGIEMVLYGESGRSSGRRQGNAGYVSYNSYSDRRGSDRYGSETRTRTGYGYEDLSFEDKRDAENVLARMDEMMATYGVASVADLYDLAGVSHSYTDNKYGWTNIRSAEIIRVRDGWVIRMPKALPID